MFFFAINKMQTLPNSIIKESNRVNGTNIQRIEDLLTAKIVDASSAVLGKDDYHGDHKLHVKDGKYKNGDEVYMISLITLGYHGKLSRFSKGRPLPLLITTANGRDENFQYDDIEFNDAGVFTSFYFEIFQYIPHGECWGRKTYLLAFEESDYIIFGRALVGFYSRFQYLRSIAVPRLLVSEIAFRFSGIFDMTPEEREDLARAREFFYRAGTLAKALCNTTPPWTPSALVGNGMVDLYNRMKGDEEENEFLGRLQTVRDQDSVRTLAKALCETTPPWTPSALVGENLALYNRMKGDEEENDFVERLQTVRDQDSAAGFAAFNNRKGCFEWMDGFWGLLYKILESGEDMKLSEEDKEKYARFEHVLEATAELRKSLGESACLPDDEETISALYTKINGIFVTSGINEHASPSRMTLRWHSFFKRYKDLEGIELLKAHRQKKIDDAAAASLPAFAASHNLKPVVITKQKARKKLRGL